MHSAKLRDITKVSFHKLKSFLAALIVVTMASWRAIEALIGPYHTAIEEVQYVA